MTSPAGNLTPSAIRPFPTAPTTAGLCAGHAGTRATPPTTAVGGLRNHWLDGWRPCSKATARADFQIGGPMNAI